MRLKLYPFPTKQLLRRWYGRNCCGTQDGYYGTTTDPNQGLSWSLGAVYIDVSFL